VGTDGGPPVPPSLSFLSRLFPIRAASVQFGSPDWSRAPRFFPPLVYLAQIAAVGLASARKTPIFVCDGFASIPFKLFFFPPFLDMPFSHGSGGLPLSSLLSSTAPLFFCFCQPICPPFTPQTKRRFPPPFLTKTPPPPAGKSRGDL